MTFAILRTKKLKSFGEIAGSLSHTYRTRPTPNADPDLIKTNWHEKVHPYRVELNIKDRLPEKVRSNAVLCIEYLMTASPEWFGWKHKKETQKYFDECIQWLRDKHGTENVISMSIHNDETTPHLIAYVVPIDPTGKLNCRHFLGGKKVLSQMQTDFHNKVGYLGLERGLVGSKLQHQTIQKFYSKLNSQTESPQKAPLVINQLNPENQPKSGFFEPHNLHGQRVMDMVYKDIKRQLEGFNNDLNIELSTVHEKSQIQIKKLQIEVDKYAEAYYRTIKENESLKKEFSPFIEYKKLNEKKYSELKLQTNNLVKREEWEKEATQREKYQEAKERKLKRQQFIQEQNTIYLDETKKYYTSTIENIRNQIDRAMNNKNHPQNQKDHYKKLQEETIKYLEEIPSQVIKAVPKNHNNIYFSMLFNLDIYSRCNKNSFINSANSWLKALKNDDKKSLNLHDVEANRRSCLASFNICQNFLMEQDHTFNYSDFNVIRELQDRLLESNYNQTYLMFKHLINEDQITQKIEDYTKKLTLEHERNQKNSPSPSELKNDRGSSLEI